MGSGGCKGGVQFSSFLTSDYFDFGACRAAGTHDGVDMYEKVECTEDTIITQYYSDANCSVVALNAENFRADFNSNGQCKKKGEVREVYSKMIFSGACPAAVTAKYVSGNVSDSVTDFANGTVYTDVLCVRRTSFCSRAPPPSRTVGKSATSSTPALSPAISNNLEFKTSVIASTLAIASSAKNTSPCG